MLSPPHPNQDYYDWWLWTESAKLKAKILGPPPNPLRTIKPLLIDRVRHGKVLKPCQPLAWYQGTKVDASRSPRKRHQANTKCRKRRSSRKQAKKLSGRVRTAQPPEQRSTKGRRTIIYFSEKHARKILAQALEDKNFGETLDALIDLLADFNLNSAEPVSPETNNSTPTLFFSPVSQESSSSTPTEEKPTAPAFDPDAPDEMESERDPFAINREWSNNLFEDARIIREREDAQIEREHDYEARLTALETREKALLQREAASKSQAAGKRVTVDLTDDDHVKVKIEPESPKEKVAVDLTTNDDRDGNVPVNVEPSHPPATVNNSPVPVEDEVRAATTSSRRLLGEVPARIKAELAIKHELNSVATLSPRLTTTTSTTVIKIARFEGKVVPQKRKREF